MRIAVGGLHTECSTYNPVTMTAADFRILRGAALTAHEEFAPLAAFPTPFQPTLHVRAIAGGRISRATYAAFRGEFLERLAALGPLDGLFLAMHGAANVEGMDDAEGDWILGAREVVGEICVIAASYDLHGNVSQRVIDQLDIFSAYRTAPHIDVAETKRRACAMLVRALETGVRPHVLWVKVPVLLPGERTSTVDEPARSLYARLPEVDAVPGVLDASMLVGYVWADEPRATASIVMTGTDSDALAREGARLAREYWNARERFRFGVRTGTIAECLGWADAAADGLVVLADSGDNPTGGGVGDRADILAELIARDARGVLVAGIADPPATAICYQTGVGARTRLRIGASLDPAGSVACETEADIVFLAATGDPAERQAVVRIGGIHLVLTAKRRPFHTLADFAALNLDPAGARLLVVKSGYLSPDLARLANTSLMALSPGVVDQDVERQSRRRIARPTYPFDRDFAWTPSVLPSARARRGVTIEVCVEGIDGFLAAAEAGADRAELCAGLVEGGLTPSLGTVRRAMRRSTTPFHVIVRPRGGDFLYSDDEFATMLEDVAIFRDEHVAGVVVGCLTPDGDIDTARMSVLAAAARPMRVTCHRAFDMTRDPFAALEALVACGIDIVLTSGQRDTALEGLALLRALHEAAAGRIVVMGCGALRPETIGSVRRESGLAALHFSALARRASAMRFRNPAVGMGGGDLDREYRLDVTDADMVRRAIQAARAG